MSELNRCPFCKIGREVKHVCSACGAYRYDVNTGSPIIKLYDPPAVWTADKDLRHIYSNDFTHDVMLFVSGDFSYEKERADYIADLCKKLNAST
jgi:hypothetical protein